MATKKKSTTSKKGKSSAADNEMRYHLISKYREVVAARYDYKAIKNHPDMPAQFNKALVDNLRSYFLENLYPVPAQREKLDEAFSELENFVVHPTKIWDLLGNITSVIFKFGLQFPAAVKAGMISMEAYTSAKHFENALTHAALKKGLTIPVSDEQFYDCLVAIPKDDLYRFISELEHLFASFTNTDLLAKTITIMDGVIERMRDKSNIYSEAEIEAIQLGIEIMQKGHDLFIQYDEDMKQAILTFITNNEKKFIDNIYSHKKAA